MRLGAVLDLIETATPGANPAATHHSVYIKSDGNLYIKDSSGTEHPAAIVTSVAGRTGAVVLAAADVAGVYYSGNANLAGTVATATAFGVASAVGVGTAYARSDHNHGSPAAPVTSAVAGTGIGVSAATGAVTFTNTGATSVAGRTGVVVLTAADIGAGTFPGAMTFAGAITVTSSGGASAITIQNDATAGRGPEIALLNTKAGQANPNKFIRTTGGVLQVINNAYTADILDLDDAGNLVLPHGNVSDSSGQVFSPGNFPTEQQVRHTRYTSQFLLGGM